MSSGARVQELLQKQKELNAETVKLQVEMLRLQNEIQRRLAGQNIVEESTIGLQEQQQSNNETQETTTPVITTVLPSVAGELQG